MSDPLPPPPEGGSSKPTSPNPNTSTASYAAAAAASSPASTIRPPVQQRGSAPAASPLGLSGIALPGTGLSPHRIGIGRPRAPSTDFVRVPGSTPATPLSPPQGIYVPGRAGSISSIDDSDGDSHATPRTGGYFPTMDAMTRRVSEVRAPSTSAPFTSPTPGALQSGSGGYGRASRPRLNNKDDQPVPRSAAVSRSASRVRLAPTPALGPTNPTNDMDDDEVEFIDRGEDLIRRRIKERKRAKRERERERRLAAAEAAGEEEDDEADTISSQPGSAQAEMFAPRTALSPVRSGRAYSRARAPSTGSRHASQTGYPVRSGSISDLDRAESLLSVPREEDSDDVAIAEAAGDLPLAEEPEEEEDESGNEEDDESGSNEDTGEITLRDRQDAINIEHPFGLPIWKPALYRKSRSVTRNAESALHSKPSAAAERHLLPGNLLWVVLFGWWLALSCFAAAVLVSGVELLAGGQGGYGQTLRGLAWYIGWPFGKYVEGEGAPDDHTDEDHVDITDSPEDVENAATYGSTDTQFTDPFQRTSTASTSSTSTVRALNDEPVSPVSPTEILRTPRRGHGVSFAPGSKAPDETVPLLRGACNRKKLNRRARQLGRLVYWPVFFLIVAPVMLFVCVICWFLVITIPMAKLTSELLWLLYHRPLEINFRSAPKIIEEVETKDDEGNGEDGISTDPSASSVTVTGSPAATAVRRPRLQAGQVAPTAGPTSTVLLCTYRAVGLQYYKYTVGGVNIMFINLLPLVFFTIFDGIVLLPLVEKAHHEGRPVPPILTMLASQGLIFTLGIASVIPLSYFLGMAVASISAQSSIGMGAVINATFGSIIEIVLYGIALTQGKGRLVEGSIVGSILAGVLLMPGASMCSGALKRKEQKFNAKSAGVTSTMLIMAIIGTLTPTLFYQTYGSFQIHCEGCPTPGSISHNPDDAWKCNRCFYEYPEPTTDPFYQHQVKSLMYACAGILLLSYLIGLWFSLRTHASQIWQNPSKVMAKEDPPIVSRNALARITPAAVMNPILPVHNAPGHHKTSSMDASGHLTPRRLGSRASSGQNQPSSPLAGRKDLAPVDVRQSPHPQASTGYTPLIESFQHGPKPGMDNIPALPAQMTQEDFRRAVHTLATAISSKKQAAVADDDDGEGGGHEAPSWSRGVSAAVLLSCTLLYAIIAEVLVDVVDVILAGSGIDEKFLGLTLFALVPNTTEFMNAMSFAMHGNIALSMEIGSAYALQVCLLQIPAMVAFSAFSNPSKFGDQIDTFTLIFPRWDVIAIILSIFLLTYTYIEARSNYHRGSILVLAYCVLVMGFYYAPVRSVDEDGGGVVVGYENVAAVAKSLSTTVVDSLSLAATKLWAYPV